MASDPTQQQQGDKPDSSLMGTQVGVASGTLSGSKAGSSEGGAERAPENAAPLGMPGAGVDIFQTLSELENRLSGLKKLHQQHTAREAVIAQRENELIRREQDGRTRAETIERQRAELASAWKELRKEQAGARAELERATALIAEADRRAVEASALSARLGEQEAGIGARQRVVGEAEARLAERERALAEQESTLGSLSETLAAREKDVSEKSESLAQRERQAESRAAELRTQQEQAERDRTGAEALRSELESKARELASVQTEAAARAEELARAESEIEEAREDIRRQNEQLRRDKGAVEEQAQVLAARSSDAETSAIFAGRVEQLQLQLGEAVAARAARESEVADLRDQMASLEESLTPTRERADDFERIVAERQAELSSERARGAAALAEVRSELERREAEIADLRAAAAGAPSPAEIEKLAGAERELRSKLAESDEARGELADRLRTMEQSMSKRAGAGVSPEELHKRDQAILALKQRFEEARAENESLLARLGEAERASAEAGSRSVQGASAPDAGSGGGGIAARRERLRRYKSLLQSQARKIVTAQNALQKRHADAEQILNQRAKISAAAIELARLEKRLNSSRARTGSAAIVMYSVATLGVLAVLSWGVSRQIWPGTFAARAVIQADAGGRQPTSDELSSWQAYHEELVKDPRLVEVAAERMNRRGLDALGNAPALLSRLNHDLYVQSSGKGSLTVELRGEGAGKTAIELDTFITAIKAVADTTREQRSTPLTTIIAQAATTDPEPLQSDHLTKALMLLGGSAAGVGLFGLAIWSRLARSKQRFEQSQAIESALDQVDWAALEKTMPRSSREKTARG